VRCDLVFDQVVRGAHLHRLNIDVVIAHARVEPTPQLILLRCLPSIPSPTRLFTDHLALGIVGPDDLRDRQQQRLMAIELRTQDFGSIATSLDGFPFELRDAQFASSELAP
jgi:hypothetical protein